MSRKTNREKITSEFCFLSLAFVCVYTERKVIVFFCSSFSFSLFSISFPHLEGAQQNDPPPSHTLLPTNRARESRCTRGQIRKNTIVVRVIISLSVCVCVCVCVCLVFTPPSLLLLIPFLALLCWLLSYFLFSRM
jgi:hypothetical protein